MKGKWIRFLDHFVEYGLYLMIFWIPISIAGILAATINLETDVNK